MFGEDHRIPERAVLLHIGPHKTGTTSIQGALHVARPRLLEHGVVYAGNVRQHRRAAMPLTGGKGLSGEPPQDRADWDQLVADVAGEPERRVIVSTEVFSEADDGVARFVVEQLGGDRVHVVVTLRPLARILPSAWQQFVRNRLRTPYDRWLTETLSHPEDRGTPGSFWRRHHHDEQVERWASIVGPERLLVVVVDETDREFLLRAFETAAGLPTGLLQEAARNNRSLTAPEIELIREINTRFHERQWPARLYHDAIRQGIVLHLQRRPPYPDEPRITTPAWAVERANEIAAAACVRIRASGVRVLGDLTTLDSVTPEPPDQQTSLESVTLTIPAGRDAVTGALRARIRYRRRKPPPSPPPSKLSRRIHRIRRLARRSTQALTARVQPGR